MADAHVTIQVTGAAASVNVNVNPASLQGPKGDPFTYEDFTPEQLEGLRGPQGIQGEKGEKGDAFEYDDFTAEQLESLRGPKGDPGTPVVDVVLPDGTDAVSGAAVAAYVDIRVAELGLYVLIIEQPVPMTVNKGETATFAVVAVGKGLTYQWQYSTDGGTSWDDSSENGNQTATLQFITDGHNGYLYRCVITDTNGNNGTTEPVMLTVIEKLEIITQPQSQVAVAGDTVTFHVEATGVASYQWQYTASEGLNWYDLSWDGATTSTVTAKMTETRLGYWYRCKLIGVDGAVAYTDTIYVAPILITQQPEDVTAAVGTTVYFTVEAEGNGLTYQWQYSKDGGTIWSNLTGTDWVSATTDTLTFTVNNSRFANLYRCKIGDSNGNVLYSNAVSVASA